MYGFDDSLRNFIDDFYYLKTLDTNNKHQHDVLELMNRIYVEKTFGSFSDLISIFNKFPKDQYKYTVISIAMIQLEDHDLDYLSQIILDSEVTLDFKKLFDIFEDDIRFVEIYLLFIVIKFNLNKVNLIIIYLGYLYDLTYRREYVLDNYEFNYISKVILELTRIK